MFFIVCLHSHSFQLRTDKGKILQLSRVGELARNLRNHNHKTTKLQHKKKTMDNEKPKRIRTAHIAFVQKTMEGATGILVKPITWKIQQGKNLWD